MNWKVGEIGGSVVSDEPHKLPVSDIHTGHSDVQYYGGHLVAESIPTSKYENLIAAAPDLLKCLKQAVESMQLETGKDMKEWTNVINKAEGKI